MSKKFLRIFFSIAVILSSGCAHQVLVSPNPTASTFTATKIPVDVGLYLSDSFKGFQHSENKLGDTWNFTNLGQASAQQIRAGLEQRFRNVIMLQSKNATQINPQPTIIVEPEVSSYTFDIPLTKFQVYPATIRFKVTVMKAGGEVVYTNIVSGVGDTSGSPGFDFAANPARSGTKAIEVGINSLLDDMLKSAGVQKLIEGGGRTGSNSGAKTL